MKQRITNRWGEVPLINTQAEHFTVFQGQEGLAYNHHPQLTSLHGRLIATWSNGFRDEDSPGQRMLLSISEDYGETWSTPRPLADRQMTCDGLCVITAEGIHAHNGLLVAYYGYYEFTPKLVAAQKHFGPPVDGRGPMLPPPEVREQFHRNHHTAIMVSQDGGDRWVGPLERVPDFVPNLAPHHLTSGRLILPGNMRFYYTDDPLGVEGWTAAGIPGLPSDYIDAPIEFGRGQRYRGDPFACCEGSCYQTDDGVVHMLLRTDQRRLAVVESVDDGVTWSEPVLTDYTDCGCRFHNGRLPDGRFFSLGCPDPEGARTPLVLASSDDGLVFDRHYMLGAAPWTPPRIPGYHKGGAYSYPSYHVTGGAFYAIYAPNKEDIAVCRIPLEDLI